MLNFLRREKLIEVCRSYTRKVNLGNYESEDFFCSAKEEATAGREVEVSAQLFTFCKEQVLADVATSAKERKESKAVAERIPMKPYEVGKLTELMKTPEVEKHFDARDVAENPLE